MNILDIRIQLMKLNLKQNHIARLLEIDAATLSKILNEKTTPDKEIIKRIEKIIEVESTNTK